MGTTKVKTISEKIKKERSEVYRAIPRLEEKGLIKKFLTIPISYKAAPISEALTKLIEANEVQHTEIRKKVTKLMMTLVENEEKKTEEPSYATIAGAKAEMAEARKAIANLQTSIDVIIPWIGLKKALYDNSDVYKKLLKKGVKVRVITNMQKGEEIPLGIRKVAGSPLFEIRSDPSISSIIIAIFDKKTTEISPDTSSLGLMGLWSSNYVLTTVMQDYFELKWNLAKEIRIENPTSKKPEIALDKERNSGATLKSDEPQPH